MGRFDNYKFHASSVGTLMTGSKDKSDPLGETCKSYLLQLWIEETYQRENDITNKYMTKGTAVEESSIDIYSLATKKMFVKNTQTFENEFIVGTPDNVKATHVRDFKSSWDIFTFHKVLTKKLNPVYDWQVNSYIAIVPGMETGSLVYCLVNTPDAIIEQEKTSLKFKMGVIDPDAHPEYLEACAKIDRNHIFDDIDISKRYIEFDVPKRDMTTAYEKLTLCRNFMNELG